MKDLPEIAPEVRGLLDEIVADPRSAIRFAPRQALRSWFGKGEAVRASAVSGTKAERHLIEVHREALAVLLCEAAVIAYWKAPFFSFRPVGADGQPCDPAEREPHLRDRVERRLRRSSDAEEGVLLLRQCLEGVRPESGRALAEASLALVPRDRARLWVGCNLPPTRSRTALAIFEHTARRTYSSEIRGLAWASAGKRLVMLDGLEDAKEAYARSAKQLPHSWFSLFNLACIKGEENEAVSTSMELERAMPRECWDVLEARRLLHAWIESRPEQERRQATATVTRVAERLSATAREVGLAYEAR